MASPHLLYTNVIKTALGALTASTEETDYDVINLRTDNYANVWRSTGDAAEWVKVDLNSAQTIKACALGNVNLTSAATVTLEGHATDSWGAPSFSEAITATSLDGVRRNLYHKLSSSQSYRWWRITFADAANQDTRIEIGEWSLGEHVEMTDSFDAAVAITHNFANTEHVTEQGQSYVYSRDRGAQLDLSWTHVQTAARNELLALFRAVKGNAIPFFFVYDPDNPAEAYFVRMTTAGIVEQKIDYGIYSMSVSLIEQPPGLIVPKD